MSQAYSIPDPTATRNELVITAPAGPEQRSGATLIDEEEALC